MSDVLIRWEETTLCAAPCALPGTKGAGKDGGSDEPLHDIGGCWRLAGRGCGDRVDVFCLSREIGIKTWQSADSGSYHTSPAFLCRRWTTHSCGAPTRR